MILCDALLDAKDNGGRILIMFDTAKLSLSIACAKQLMLKLTEDIFEVADE